MKRALCLAALALSVSSCGAGSDEPSAVKTVTVTETAKPTASETPITTPTPATESTDASPTGPAEPNVGDTALLMGEWREGTGLRTRVLKVNQADAALRPDYLSDASDAEGATVEVRQCVRKETEGPTTLGTYNFLGRGKNGAVYESASSSWDTWPPLPQFPFEKNARAGDCIQGWILISAPDGTRLSTIELVDDTGTTYAEWLI